MNMLHATDYQVVISACQILAQLYKGKPMTLFTMVTAPKAQSDGVVVQRARRTGPFELRHSVFFS